MSAVIYPNKAFDIAAMKTPADDLAALLNSMNAPLPAVPIASRSLALEGFVTFIKESFILNHAPLYIAVIATDMPHFTSP